MSFKVDLKKIDYVKRSLNIADSALSFVFFEDKKYNPFDYFIAGSCILNLYHKWDHTDIDVFKMYIHNKLSVAIKEYEKNKYVDLSSNTNKLMFNIIDNNVTKKDSYFDNIKDILDQFDFVHTCAFYYKNKLYLTDNVYEAIDKRLLILNYNYLQKFDGISTKYEYLKAVAKLKSRVTKFKIRGMTFDEQSKKNFDYLMAIGNDLLNDRIKFTKVNVNDFYR